MSDQVELGHIRAYDGTTRIVRVTDTDGNAYDVTLTGPDRGMITEAPPIPKIDAPVRLDIGDSPTVTLTISDGRQAVIGLARLRQWLEDEYRCDFPVALREGPGSLPCEVVTETAT